MNGLPLYQEAIGHFFAGMAIAFGDRAFSQNSSRNTDKRKNEKLEQVTSMHYLIETETSEDRESIKQSKEYCDAVKNTKDYFQDRGISVKPAEYSGFIGKYIKRPINHVSENLDREKVNNLSWKHKLTASFGIEFLADAGVAVSSIAFGKGNMFYALGESLYQGPCLFAGLVTGKGILKVKDVFYRSKEEKELDSMALELTGDNKLLEIINSYSPTEHLKISEDSKYAKSKVVKDKTELSEKISSGIINTASEITGSVAKTYTGLKDRVKEKLEARVKEKEQKREKRKKKLTAKYAKY